MPPARRVARLDSGTPLAYSESMPALPSSFLAVGMVAVATCGSPSTPSAQPVAFASIVSFGFCAPSLYCTSRLELSEREAVLTYESGQQAPLVRRRDLQPSEWQGLVAALDATRLRALPNRIGCPDCADGGAETLTVAFAEGPSSSVTFEYGQDVPGIAVVQAQIRSIRDSFDRPETGPLS
jgi:hypothetical protein